MPEPIITNAIIDSVSLRLDRDVFLCAWVFLRYPGAGQGFGGHVLGGLPGCKAGQHRSQPNFAAEAIVGILRVAGVTEWGKVTGKAVRVKKADDYGDVLAIGHIIEDVWYEPSACFAGWREHP